MQQPAQGRFSTSYQIPQSAHKIAPLVQRIIKNVDPNYFNSRLQGYAIHNAQIDYPEGYHLVFYASTYELMPHSGYQNPYSYNAQQLQQPLAQGQQAQVQGSQAQAQG